MRIQLDNDSHANVQHVFNSSSLKSKCSNAFKVFFHESLGLQGWVCSLGVRLERSGSINSGTYCIKNACTSSEVLEL